MQNIIHLLIWVTKCCSVQVHYVPGAMSHVVSSLPASSGNAFLGTTAPTENSRDAAKVILMIMTSTVVYQIYRAIGSRIEYGISYTELP